MISQGLKLRPSFEVTYKMKITKISNSTIT